jgi:hypothetical protein
MNDVCIRTEVQEDGKKLRKMTCRRSLEEATLSFALRAQQITSLNISSRAYTAMKLKVEGDHPHGRQSSSLAEYAMYW